MQATAKRAGVGIATVHKVCQAHSRSLAGLPPLAHGIPDPTAV